MLETLYSKFDQIAEKRGVFKVETIGDSYVAVAGLPDPRPDHPIVMAKFASDCRDKMAQLTKELETTLGPDTAELQLRFGLNSGPVTAGVLRGQKSRKFKSQSLDVCMVSDEWTNVMLTIMICVRCYVLFLLLLCGNCFRFPTIWRHC